MQDFFFFYPASNLLLQVLFPIYFLHIKDQIIRYWEL